MVFLVAQLQERSSKVLGTSPGCALAALVYLVSDRKGGAKCQINALERRFLCLGAVSQVCYVQAVSYTHLRAHETRH